MNPDDDDDNDFDPINESDASIRELRLEIVRLEARLDQLLAAEQERIKEMEELLAQRAEVQALIDDLAREIEDLKRFRKTINRRLWKIGLVSSFIGVSIGQLIVSLFF